MRRYFLMAAVAAVLTGLTTAGGAAAGAAGPGTRAVPGAQLWVSRFGGGGTFQSSAMAVSPQGKTVFVTGASFSGLANGVDYKTVAYNTATGRQLWVSRYSGPGHHQDHPTAVAVSPDGAAVFVTGYAPGWGTRYDYATVAYSAATGKQLWASRYTSPGGHDDGGTAVAVSPDGATVFVTGTCCGLATLTPGGGEGTQGDDYATVAYSAATGKQLWASRYNGPTNWNAARSLAVSPDGATVFVTGYSVGQKTGYDYATVAYSAATGRQLWVSRYNGKGNGADIARSVAVSPDGATVFVTGRSDGTTSVIDYATVAYNAATGKQLWVSRYNGPANGDDIASSVAVSPDGATVFVTGGSFGGNSLDDYATVAYRAVTGKQLWVSRYNGPTNGDDDANAVAVSADGSTVFVTGSSENRTAADDYATVAYSAATGRQLWASRYKGLVGNDATVVAVSPDGSTVFVTGSSETGGTGFAYATVAYRG